VRERCRNRRARLGSRYGVPLADIVLAAEQGCEAATLARAQRANQQTADSHDNMGSFKGLFLGVYASNSLIRTLFLPLCYFLLSSPFLLVLARYYGFDGRLFEIFGKDKSVKEIALQVFVGLVAATLPTRILSGKTWVQDQDGGTRRVQQIPYWIPQVRHWGSVVFGGEGWLKNVRYECEPLSELISIGADKFSGIRHLHLLSH
jgi:hypothetical protein